jgi:two-component system, NtrC family, response regulator HydG
MIRICVVEDDVSFGKLIKNYLERKKYEVTLFSNANAAVNDLISGNYPLVICDIRLPDLSGVELMKKVKSTNNQIDFIFMTSYANVSSAVEAIKSGGYDYIAKPFHPEQILELIKNYFEQEISKPTEVQSKPNESYILGNSEPTKRLLQHINLVAPTEFSVIINGESGSGKEVIAKMLHQKSSRSEKPFVAIDCGTIPDEIASSAFFGHVKGAFTGAIHDAKGYF